MKFKIFRKTLLLAAIASIHLLSYAQDVTNTKRKEIGRYKQLSFTRYIQDSDTSYVISFPNLTYTHIIDLSFTTFSKTDLLDFANAIKALDKVKYIKGETNAVTLKNGFYIDKVKGLGMWVSIHDKDRKYTNLPMNQARLLSDDILSTLYP